MKKIVSLLLCLLLCGSVTATAFAAEAPAADAQGMVEQTATTESAYTPPQTRDGFFFYNQTGFSYPQKKVILTVGTTVTLEPSGFDANGLPYGLNTTTGRIERLFRWKDYAIGSVIDGNLFKKKLQIKAMNPGRVVMNVTAGKKKAKLVIQVVPKGSNVAVSKLSVKGKGLKSKMTMQVGDNLKLNASYKPSNATNAAISFKSSAPRVVEVTSNGYLTAYREGKAVITVKAGGKTSKYRITVKAEATPSAAAEPAAGAWMQPGTYTGGVDLAVGEYIARNVSGKVGNVSILLNGEKVYDLNFINQLYFKVNAGDQVVITDAVFNPSALVPSIPQVNGMWVGGMYKVGRDIKAGVYKVSNPFQGYNGSVIVFDDSLRFTGADEYNTWPVNYGESVEVYLKTGQYVNLANCRMAAA